MENKNIENYLNKFRVTGSDVKYNYISMDLDFKGKFYINNNDLEEFYKIYAESVKNKKLSIGERPQDYGPILIDIDLKINTEKYDGNRLYNNEMILLIIDTYREALKNYLKLDDYELYASIFEKRKPTIKDNFIKDGFHIIFRNITAHYKLRYVVRNYVVEKLKDNYIFKIFNESIDKIIDKCIIHTNCWLLPYRKNLMVTNIN